MGARKRLRLLTVNAGKDLDDEQYYQMFLQESAGMPDRDFEAALGGVVSNGWISKYRRRMLKPNARFKTALRALADDMPPAPMRPAQAVELNAHPDAAVYTTVPEGELAHVVMLSNTAPGNGSGRLRNLGSDKRKSVSLELHLRERLNARRKRLGLSWDQMGEMLEQYLDRSDY